MSVIKHKGQRVGIFIDTQNLYHSGKNLYKSKVNFGQIVKDALAGRSLIRAVAYVITTESGEEKGFFDALSKVGIETKTKNLQIFSSGAKKADWDVGMAVDAIKLAPKLDAVVLITGDGDFVPLVEYLQENQGCQVEVASFGKSCSAKLIEVADDFLDLDSNPRRYLMISGPVNGNGRRRMGAPRTPISTKSQAEADALASGEAPKVV
ncbi:MAG TPA: NYN domain-containing protein [Candidatus Nanoarchaeia archaeon]|nr:NYN domain-containing protein [Candidatus Nanoarchaeia archaeon]